MASAWAASAHRTIRSTSAAAASSRPAEPNRYHSVPSETPVSLGLLRERRDDGGADHLASLPINCLKVSASAPVAFAASIAAAVTAP